MTVQGPVKKHQPDGMSHGGIVVRKFAISRHFLPFRNFSQFFAIGFDPPPPPDRNPCPQCSGNCCLPRTYGKEGFCTSRAILDTELGGREVLEWPYTVGGGGGSPGMH